MRDIRDILAECVRSARLGPSTYTWDTLTAFGQEQHRREADRSIRLLETQGVRLVRVGEPAPASPVPSSPIIYADRIVGRDAERQLRKGDGDAWEVLKVEGDKATVQLTFTLVHAYDLAGRALQGDRDVASAPGILTTLAAALEIHRCNAVTVTAP